MTAVQAQSSNNLQVNPFLVKSDLDSNREPFRESAKGENFQPETWHRDNGKLLPKNDATLVYQQNEVNRS